MRKRSLIDWVRLFLLMIDMKVTWNTDDNWWENKHDLKLHAMWKVCWVTWWVKVVTQSWILVNFCTESAPFYTSSD